MNNKIQPTNPVPALHDNKKVVDPRRGMSKIFKCPRCGKNLYVCNTVENDKIRNCHLDFYTCKNCVFYFVRHNEYFYLLRPDKIIRFAGHQSTFYTSDYLAYCGIKLWNQHASYAEQEETQKRLLDYFEKNDAQKLLTGNTYETIKDE